MPNGSYKFLFHGRASLLTSSSRTSISSPSLLEAAQRLKQFLNGRRNGWRLG
jgi:hypothetical protein